MFELTSLPWSAWLISTGLIGALIGLLICLCFPGFWSGHNYRFTATVGTVSGIIISSIVGGFFPNPLLVFFAGLLSAYFGSRFIASIGSRLIRYLVQTLKTGSSELKNKPVPAETQTIGRVLFRHDWDARPRYGTEEEEEGLFVGRRDILERLTSDFLSKRSGTILISGVRGVGKTALVERALLDARNELQNRYWKKALPMLRKAPFWRPLEHRVLEELLSDQPYTATALDENYPAIKTAAANYAQLPARGWRRLSPTDRLIRRLHRASRSQLFVLKFNASDIGGAMAEPEQNAISGRPNVNPEKLLRALIRKLFMTCHSSRRTVEAEILRWSLRDKRERRQFFDTLQSAYDKSVSKSYKEIISNSVNEAIKRSQSLSSERKISVERVLGLIVCLAFGGAVSWFGWKQNWKAFEWLTAGGGAAALTGYFTWTRTSKSSRETLFDRARQAQFSYEYDYSLARMEYDLEAILGTLREPKKQPFDPYRCFTRKVIIFDELDKLKNPIKQLNDVITHFKNFFTLSDALFVFITDHDFYEHLEDTKARLKRHYSEEHTFFTQKLYLRKPDFEHFNETVYRFCDVDLLKSRVRTASLDPDLLEFLVEFLRREKSDLFEPFEGWSELPTLTYLYINRDKYSDQGKAKIEAAFNSIGLKDLAAVAQVWAAMITAGKDEREARVNLERAFEEHGGPSNPLAVAQIWAAMVSAGMNGADWRRRFVVGARGWDNPEAVSFLHSRRYRFSPADRNLISSHYGAFTADVMEKYSSVDEVSFTLSDLARALCFQTRNHYFDLYHLIYDYVGSYSDGLPMLHMGEERFTREHRLWSRYQQLIQAAFKHRQEDHPSREYFNALLMEALYCVFDTRGLDKPVKIKDILFSPQKTVSAQAAPARPTGNPAPKASTKKPGSAVSKPLVAGRATGNKPSSSLDRDLETITPREQEQINQAILRLLRIAAARKAIRVEGDFEKVVKDANGRLDKIAGLNFTWEPDCEPVITQEGLDPESHEKDLIQFWDDNQIKLEALDRELEKAWTNLELPKDSPARKMKDLIARLKTTAEGLRRRDITSISQYDASKLKADIRTPDSWILTTLDFVIERIGAEADADIANLVPTKEAWTSYPFLMDLESRRTEIETMVARLPLRAIVRPKNTDCLMYFLGGAILDLKALDDIPNKDAHLFWYAPGLEPSDTSELNLPSSIRFYFPPPASNSISTLLADYGLTASSVRLQQMAGTSAPDYRRAGIELIGPLTGLGEIITLLSQPELTAALQSLNEFPAFFKANPGEFWTSYGVDLNKWSANEAATVMAGKIASQFKNPSPDLLLAVEKVISHNLNNDLSKISTSPILAMSGPPNARLLLQEQFERFVHGRLVTAHINNSKFEELVVRDFVPWLLNSIETIARNRNVDLSRISLIVPTLAPDLEKQKLAP